MDVAQPLLEPDHGLAVAGEAEMAGLDDPGMDRPDGDLMQSFADRGQERVWKPRLIAAVRPDAMVEPGSEVGRAGRHQTIEVMDRALEPLRRRVQPAERRKPAIVAEDAGDADLAAGGLEQDRVDLSQVGEQRHEVDAASNQGGADIVPRRSRDRVARPRPMLRPRGADG